MNFYFLTDESEKSLAPFFSKRVLETVMAGVVIVGIFLLVFWSRRPLAEFIAAGDGPRIFFLILVPKYNEHAHCHCREYRFG